VRAHWVIAAILAAAPAAANADELTGTAVVFARGGALYRLDHDGPDAKQGARKLAELPAKPTVRALRTDNDGKILLVDLGGAWSWMPLDGSAPLAPLPCADGPAQVTPDGACVLCRAKAGGSLIVQLATGKQLAVNVPIAGARIVGKGSTRRVMWADAKGIWSAPPAQLGRKQLLAPESPLRNLSIGPEGARGVGTYAGEVHGEGKTTKPAELLFGFALDGTAARRKAIKDGVPLAWSRDGEWVLVQDGGNACIMRAIGGQYKCWRGYTAASISADGKWALVLGNRDGSKTQAQAKAKAKPKARPAATKPATDEGGESDEGMDADAASAEDTAVPPPSGPLALYRAKLEGAFTDPPILVDKIVDGAAVWIPAPAPPATAAPSSP
jgi:hypothetical protein